MTDQDEALNLPESIVSPDPEPLGVEVDESPTLVLDPAPAETEAAAEPPAVPIEDEVPPEKVWPFPPPPPADLAECLDYLRNVPGRPPEYRMTATMRLRDFTLADGAWHALGAALAEGEEAGFDGYATPIIRAALRELVTVAGDVRAAAMLTTEGICRGTGWVWSPLKVSDPLPEADKVTLRLPALDMVAVQYIGAFLKLPVVEPSAVLRFALHYAALMLPEGGLE